MVERSSEMLHLSGNINILYKCNISLLALYIFKTTTKILIKKIFFWLCHAACRILVPQPGIETEALAMKVPSPNHRTTGNFQKKIIFHSTLSKVSCIRLWTLCKDFKWLPMNVNYWNLDLSRLDLQRLLMTKALFNPSVAL